MKDWLVVSFIKFLSLLPLSISRALGAFLGGLLWRGRGREKRVTITNLQLCFPELSEAEVHALARESL